MSNFGTAESDGFTVISNTRTSEQVAEDIKEPEKAPVASPAPQGDGEPTPEAEAARAKHRAAEKHDPRARMLEATRQASEAKKERDEARFELERLKAEKRPEVRPEPAPKQAEPSDKPSDDDPKFTTYGEYVEALADWKLEQKEKQILESQALQIMEESKQAVYTSFEGLMKAETEANPGWIDRVDQNLLNLQPSSELPPGQRPARHNALADLIIYSPVAPKLLMHFTEHPEELQKLGELHPLRFGVEFGNIESRLRVATTAPTPVEVSKARPPVRPVTGGPTTGDRVPGENASFEEHAAFYDALERKKRSAR